MKKIGIYLSLVVYLLYPGRQNSLWADLSGFFPSSLTHQSSGLFKWSSWDYVTNPYIYNQQERDVISTIFTPNINNGLYSVGGRLTIFIPIYFALSFKNQGTRLDVDREGTENDGYLETFDRSIEFMVGSTIYGIGIGFYARFRSYHLNERENENTSEKFGTFGSLSVLNNKNRLPGNHYGLQFGQYTERKEQKNSYSWAGNIEYADLRSVYEEGGVIIRDSPRLNTFNYTDILSSIYTGDSTGRNRQEVSLKFLGWVPAGYSADVGTDLQFLIPFGSGEDTNLVTNISEGASLSGIDMALTAFYDKDFFVDIDQTESVFRIQPVFSYIYRSEKVARDLGEEFSFNDNRALLWLNFKYVLYLNQSKSFYLLMGWNPLITLYNKYEEAHRFRPESENNEERDFTTEKSTLKDAPFKVTLANYSLGLGYDLSKNLSFYIQFGAIRGSGSVIANPKDFRSTRGRTEIETNFANEIGSNEQLSIIQISFGADFKFDPLLPID